MTTDSVYEFLKDNNRPFSANDILTSVGKADGKAAIQKALDKLTSNNKILEKFYGKQRIYCVKQNETLNSDDMATSLRQMDQQISETSTNLASVQEKLQSGSAELKNLKSKMSMEEAIIERDKLVEETAGLKAKLNKLKENAEPVSDADKKKIKSEHEMCVKEYRKRKRMCSDITNSILEGYPKTKKYLFEEIGIETDEEVNFELKV